MVLVVPIALFLFSYGNRRVTWKGHAFFPQTCPWIPSTAPKAVVNDERTEASRSQWSFHHLPLFLPHLCLLLLSWAFSSSPSGFARVPIFKFHSWDFPGGAVVRNPSANAGDTGLIPGPGRSNMPRSNWARAPQLQSLRSRAHVPQLLKPACLEPVLHNKRSHRNEKPTHRVEE